MSTTLRSDFIGFSFARSQYVYRYYYIICICLSHVCVPTNDLKDLIQSRKCLKRNGIAWCVVLGIWIRRRHRIHACTQSDAECEKIEQVHIVGLTCDSTSAAKQSHQQHAKSIYTNRVRESDGAVNAAQQVFELASVSLIYIYRNVDDRRLYGFLDAPEA